MLYIIIYIVFTMFSSTPLPQFQNGPDLTVMLMESRSRSQASGPDQAVTLKHAALPQLCCWQVANACQWALPAPPMLCA
jgi:hypothetical protein